MHRRVPLAGIAEERFGILISSFDEREEAEITRYGTERQRGAEHGVVRPVRQEKLGESAGGVDVPELRDSVGERSERRHPRKVVGYVAERALGEYKNLRARLVATSHREKRS